MLAKAEKLEKAEKEQRQLDAVNAQTPASSGQKVCFNMRDHGSCKHGNKCRFSHDKSQVARKAKKEAERGRSTDVGAAGSGQRRPSSQDKGAGKDKKSLPRRFLNSKKGCLKGDKCEYSHKHKDQPKKKGDGKGKKGDGRSTVPGVQLSTMDGPAGLGEEDQEQKKHININFRYWDDIVGTGSQKAGPCQFTGPCVLCGNG